MPFHIENLELPVDDLLADSNETSKCTGLLKDQAILVLKNYMSENLINQIQRYLIGIGRQSLPNYQMVTDGCPNFHRINRWDERAYVKGCWHQFSFFPWNQDLFDLFQLFRNVYRLKNRFSGSRENRFLDRKSEEGVAARLGFQFYPKGIGELKRHRDAADYHQISAAILVMSKRGVDFQQGGLFVENSEEEKLFIEDITNPGDVVFFHSQMIHGVDTIDPDEEPDWLEFKGRWSLLLAFNRLNSNQSIAPSEELPD